MLYMDPTWLLLMLVTVAIGGATQFYIKSTFNKWSRISTQNGLTGAQVAEKLLEINRIKAPVGHATGEGSVAVRRVAGHLTDHYDPRTGVVALSEPVFGETSVSAVAVAAHEVGHAVQDAENYVWGELRTRIVPVVNFGSSMAGVLIIFGFVVGLTELIWVGIAGYSLAVLFQLITLPVELDASKRALTQLEVNGLLTVGEVPAARQVLTAAALTYLAGALIAVLNLIYYIGLARRS